MKKIWMSFTILGVIILAFFLYQLSLAQSIYNGLPTVPCIDTTLPIKQSFTFHLSITISGKPYPINNSLGHDYGKCLHVIYANDSSGTIFVKSNDTNKYILGQVFDEWHKTFNPHQIMQYGVTQNHTIKVLVNNQNVEDYRNIILKPDQTIQVIYE